MREDLQNARNTIFMLVKDLKIKKKNTGKQMKG